MRVCRTQCNDTNQLLSLTQREDDYNDADLTTLDFLFDTGCICTFRYHGDILQINLKNLDTQGSGFTL
jgi:hypothetical protein